MGLLADIYSTIDTGKRKFKGLLDDPAGTIDAGARRFREDNQANIGNMLTGFGLLGNNSVLLGQAQKDAAQRAVADYGANHGIASVVGYHGTMNPNFDKFNLDSFGKTDSGWLGKGVYAAKSPVDASAYAMVDGKPGGAVFKVDMDLKNPLSIDWESANRSELLAKRKELGPEGFSSWLKSMGHDGVMFQGPRNALNSSGERDIQYMAIDPQIVKQINY